jgi:hypothetical protein
MVYSVPVNAPRRSVHLIGSHRGGFGDSDEERNADETLTEAPDSALASRTYSAFDSVRSASHPRTVLRTRG